MPSGQELLASKNVNRFFAIKQELQRRAAEAREDFFAFFDFVIREERTQLPITIAPHQRVGVEFILAHERSVHFWPIGHSKTFTLGALLLWDLGRNPTMRGAIISATQNQAEKVLKFVRDYIENSHELRAVFPHLKPSKRKGDSWTQTAITVERPPGIRDPSLVAVGLNGALAGARLNRIVIDDILDPENTATKEQRQKTIEWVDSVALARLDPRGSRVVVINTPWHREDLPHELERRGWASMRMSVLGDITIRDDAERMDEAEELGIPFVPWDSAHIKPANNNKSPEGYDVCRLVEHGEDKQEEVPLWPERMNVRDIAKKRREHLPHRFNQLFLMKCHDDEIARCKIEWIEKCKKLARERGLYQLTSHYRDTELVFTGVDLAVSPGEENDLVAFFTFAVLEGGFRRILDIEAGQWDGPTILKKLFKKVEQFNSVVRVENNGAQEFLLQFARSQNVGVPVKPHTTGRAKAHPEHGVEGLFLELYNGAWLIPNDKHGRCPPEVQAWIDDCLNYVPSKHTPDRLMSSYFAREMAKEWGVLSGSDTAEMHHEEGGPSVGMQVMAR